MSTIDPMAPAEPKALAHSIECLDRHADACLDEITNWQDYGESVWLVLHELKRLRAAGWQPLDTAPKDGTIIDVWRPEGGRDTVFWGYPHHECGEMGRLCDSDWHSIRAPGWVCSTFGEFVGRNHAPFTHWMPLPAAPTEA